MNKEKTFDSFLDTVNKSQTAMNAIAKGGTLMKKSYLKLLIVIVLPIIIVIVV
jgi:hypothetical protein